ncbi:helix-turn-helix domain-containing protein [Chloroflexota bacterium]
MKKLTYSVNETARILGISRNLAYDMVRCGEIPSLRFGKRIVIPKIAIDQLLVKPSSKVSTPDT